MAIFLILLLLVIIFLYYYPQILERDKKISSYELRSDFFNRSEFIFYQLLEENISKKFMIFSKTRIEDFIRVKSGLWKNETWWLRSRIKSRHVDFLICNELGTPRLAIEIDGGSHNNPNRQERDNFLDRIYNEVGLEVIHIRVGENFEQRVRDIVIKLQNANPPIS